MSAVVKFTDNSFAVVPTCWLQGNNYYWSNLSESSILDKSMKENPNTDWTVRKVDIKGVYPTFEEARKALKEQRAEQEAKQASSKTKGGQTSQNSSFTEATTEVVAGGSRVSSNDSEPENKDDELAGIATGVSNLNVNDLHEKLQSGKGPLLKDMNDLESLETALLEDAKIRILLYDELSQIVKLRSQLREGFDMTVEKLLEKLMSDELAKSFNWTGRNEKNCFSSLQIVPILKRAVRSNESFKNSTDEEIKKVIQDWLKGAPSRSNRKK